MEALSLDEAEQLKKIVYPIMRSYEEKYFLEIIRELYAHGFIVSIPGDILWDNFKSMMEDLGITD